MLMSDGTEADFRGGLPALSMVLKLMAAAYSLDNANSGPSRSCPMGCVCSVIDKWNCPMGCLCSVIDTWNCPMVSVL